MLIMDFQSKTKIAQLLEAEYVNNNTPEFIECDPIQIPHNFKKQEDIEISAFLTAQIAWGKRSMIIRNGYNLMNIMDNSPYDFVLNASNNELKKIDGFVHRTFNADDCRTEIMALRRFYTKYNNLGAYFESVFNTEGTIRNTLIRFRNDFLNSNHPPRFTRHISDVKKKSAAKRLNLLLMWMCRNDGRGVHFGLWNIPTSALMIPLDVHCGNAARSMGLLNRKQNDWLAVEELTIKLREFDPHDPVKYDFSLFGLSIQGKLKTCD
ncbi:MAG: TIGR02757 family protein [Spirochaetes bacterium]|nr:TIGR02757 family protein [Spirochaetota bacterium]MBN2771289.1 TIGR02757 family protein [Spirochaetota bacterium]